MSAIAVLVHADDRPCDPAELHRMGAALASLGESTGAWHDGPAGLLHRSDGLLPEDALGPQPLAGTGGRFVLAFDGRIDARNDLVEALGIDASATRQISDAGLVLRAWERWEEDALQRLVGSFAFAVWDTQERTLHAAASPSDARTLHYASDAGRIALSTMPRGLFALPGFRRAVDEVKVADFLLDLQDPARSYWAGVSVLPPGHRLRYRGGTLDVRRFWSPFPVRPVRFRRDEEYVEAFLTLLDRVVRDQLRGATPVAVSLSGGLDSSSVAASAALVLAAEGRRLLALTEVPREGFAGPVPAGRYADETPFVTAVARRHPNIDLAFVRTGGTFLDGLEESFAHREAPFRNAFNRGWLLAVNEEARRRGARVVLTGVGGNMTASWSGVSLLEQHVRRLRWARAFREARSLAGDRGVAGAARTLGALGFFPLLPRAVRHAVRGALRAAGRRRDAGWASWSLARPEFVAEQRAEERARILSNGLLDRSLMSPAEGRAWFSALGSGGSFEAGCRSQHGVDLRNPLLDARLVALCLGVPDGQCLRDGRSRWLIRRAMEERLPPEVLDNPRRGLQAADWADSFRAALPRLRERVEGFRRNGLLARALDLPRLERLVDLVDGKRAVDPASFEAHGAALGAATMLGSFVLWAEAKAREERVTWP